MSGEATFWDYAIAVAFPLGTALIGCLCRVLLWLTSEDGDDDSGHGA